MDLGLQDGEFWRLTPRQYWAMVRHHARRRRQLFLQIASVTAIVAEVHRDKTKRFREFRADDFCIVPSPDPSAPSLPQSAEEQIKIFRFITEGIGG